MALSVVVIFLALQATAHAAKFNRVLNIGDRAPAWGELKSIDGRAFDLADFADKSAVVVVFFANKCPVSKAYTGRLNEIAKAYRERGVTIVAVSVSQAAADDFEAMQVRAREQKFQFEYAQDLSQQIARNYGATATPQVFVLDRDRKISYMGTIDDAPQQPVKVTEPYLRWALDAALQGEPPEFRETKPVGCEIEWK